MTTAPTRVPARVLGCLRRGELTIIVLPDVGMANGGVVREIPIQIVPFDLRMPNSKFDVEFDFDGGEWQVFRR